MPSRAAVLLVLAAGLLVGTPARASEPPPPDGLDRPAPPPRRSTGRHASPDAETSGRIPRVVDGSPGYVGSDYGLGKPAFTGLGSRPDWGRGGY